MPGPLEGITVLSFCTALSGPFAAMVLGDMGAEIIKIESVDEGDLTRASTHKINGVGSYFLSVNRGKKSITLNLKDDRAKKIVLDLAQQMDVLIENFRPGVMERLGFDYETVRKINPRIIYASISGFGQTGPYSHKPAFDMIAQAMGGVVSITGPDDPGAPPVRVGYSIGDMASSLFTATGILAAIIDRDKTGLGQRLDVSMMDCQVALCENAIARYLGTGEISRPLGSRHPLSTPFQAYSTKDKPIVVIANTEKLWANFCRAAEKEEWITDEKYKTKYVRLENYTPFNADMTALMKTRTFKEWAERFEAHDVMYAPINTIEEIAEDPQVKAREMIVELDHPKAGKHRVVGTPLKFSKTPLKIDKAAPELGADTYEILSQRLGLSDAEIEKLKNANII
ncbi:MAG: CoA transferase [Proteobacteria bacterium]|nr:CoA transferase [Pseudomonadota bacterium]MBU4471276.1 CoA transferase [Pseudomonadota bacterium]MCG2753896.1 CoA transferase [Desulfobacteraceae bacterium]